ncbi:Uncharacterized protein APZ42_024389 [Daphnia magna]|uniref:Integrase p58-like C-terminal domain-containing protein n=1 Tax=Daphnia magna TaxID=35525 RepID=A0A164U2N4_9CRUS|nr:Uncharacterized protein APZ42_024389 [Daphnia magna]
MRTTAYHPQTDRLVERFYRTLCDMLACYVVDEPQEWDKYLPFDTFAYNTSKQATLKDNPFYLLHGREPVLLNDIKINRHFETHENESEMYNYQSRKAQELAKEHLPEAQTKQKRYYDEGMKSIKYDIGDLVLLKVPISTGKFINRWNGPFRITRHFSDITYEIQNIDSENQESIAHANRLKFYTPREPIIITKKEEEGKVKDTNNSKRSPRRTENIPKHKYILRSNRHQLDGKDTSIPLPFSQGWTQ